VRNLQHAQDFVIVALAGSVFLKKKRDGGGRCYSHQNPRSTPDFFIGCEGLGVASEIEHHEDSSVLYVRIRTLIVG